MKFIFKIIFSKKKKFSKKFKNEFHLQILEKAKNFIISFSFPLNFNGVVGERIWQASSFSHPQRFVGKKVFLKVSFPQEMRFEMKIILRNEFRVPKCKPFSRRFTNGI